MFYLESFSIVAALVSLSCSRLTVAQTSLSSVLDQADNDVKDIAKQAAFNRNNICELLSQCTEANCTRRSCRPQGEYEISHLQCLSIYNNSLCSNNYNIYASTEQSYVRVSPLASEDNHEFQTSVCTQKPIHQKLQQVWQRSNKEHIGWIFIGTPQGFLYSFPGRDLTEELCSQYDPRKRPWYINSLAIVKSVYVLLDASSSMSRRIGTLSPESCLEVAQSLVSQLLSMFTNEDWIAVSTMDGQMVAPPILVSLDGIDISEQQPKVKALKESVGKVTAGSSKVDIDRSLEAAVQFFSSRSNLKVLFILSDGDFVSAHPNVSNSFQKLNDGSIVIFFYKIGYDPSSDSSLQQLRRVINMTIESVTDSYDPLLKLRSYFDYLAWLRFVNTNQSTLWAPLYGDYLGLGNVTTTTFPAFDGNQRLIGVAGLDFVARSFIHELGFPVVQEAVSRRSPPPSRVQSPSLPLLSPDPTPNASESCPRAELHPLCSRKDFTTPLLKFICCGDGSDEGKRKRFWNSGKLVGLSIAGTFALVATVGLVFACKRWRRRRRNGSTLPLPRVDEQEWIKPKTSPEINNVSMLSNN